MIDISRIQWRAEPAGLFFNALLEEIRRIWTPPSYANRWTQEEYAEWYDACRRVSWPLQEEAARVYAVWSVPAPIIIPMESFARINWNE